MGNGACSGPLGSQPFELGVVRAAEEVEVPPTLFRPWMSRIGNVDSNPPSWRSTLNTRELMIVALALHTVGFVGWIGGLSFAYVDMVFSARTLRTYAWLSIWRRTFARFLGWSWVGITVVIVTGLVMASVVSGGSGELPAYIRAMMVSGMGAMAAFAYLYFMPWRLLNKAIWKSDLAAVEKRLRQIRLLVVMTMFLGLVTAMVGASGPYLQ